MHFNFFTYFFHAPWVDKNLHVFTMLFVGLILTLAAIRVRSQLVANNAQIAPSEKLSLTNIFELVAENLYTLVEGILGVKAKKHFPFIGTLFLFIFVSNLIGLFPGFIPPTGNLNTNLACAVCVFIYFNWVGIKEQGLFGYLKHFMGPVWWIGPFIFAIEMFGTFLRPATLSLRLFANIQADHKLLETFSALSPIFVPVLLLILGLFVSFVQAFVFTLLSTIYINLAASHDDEHH